MDKTQGVEGLLRNPCSRDETTCELEDVTHFTKFDEWTTIKKDLSVLWAVCPDDSKVLSVQILLITFVSAGKLSRRLKNEIAFHRFLRYSKRYDYAGIAQW